MTAKEREREGTLLIFQTSESISGGKRYLERSMKEISFAIFSRLLYFVTRETAVVRLVRIQNARECGLINISRPVRRCPMRTTCNVSRRIKGRYTRKRENVIPTSRISGTPALFRYVYTPESSGLKISAPLKCTGRRLRPSRSYDGIERAVSLSRSRSVWTPGRVSTGRRGDSRIFVARNRTAVYNRDICTACIQASRSFFRRRHE